MCHYFYTLLQKELEDMLTLSQARRHGRSVMAEISTKIPSISSTLKSHIEKNSARTSKYICRKENLKCFIFRCLLILYKSVVV